MGGVVTDCPRIDLLFQYALARAAHADDFRWRQLGPIHLLKCAYMADVAHAARNEGVTFSGIEWRFHHFGPWSVDAYARIAPALVVGARADERRFSSPYNDDHVRYSFDAQRADQIEADVASRLPFSVTGAINRAVNAHGSDTASLLRDVYLTAPMLAAQPGAALDFSAAVEPTEAIPERPQARRTTAERRRRKAELADARENIRQSIAARRPVPPLDPPPRYDDVFFKGREELDRQAGDPLRPSSGTITFDDSVWSSSQRRDPTIP